MRPGGEPAADWQDASDYAALLHVGRSGFAWEWLRRDESYRAAAIGARQEGRSSTSGVDSGAAQWGLHAFEAPDRTATSARPVWRREVCPYVLEAAATDEGHEGDRLCLERLGRFVALVVSPAGTEHLLLSDGSRSVPVDIVVGTLRDGPALLQYRLAGLRRLDPPLLTLRRLVALSRTGKFAPALHPAQRRAKRWILLLRTHDALTIGASQRAIAEALLSLDPGERRWRVNAPSVRSRVQRLVCDARRVAAGGYLDLLKGP